MYNNYIFLKFLWLWWIVIVGAKWKLKAESFIVKSKNKIVYINTILLYTLHLYSSMISDYKLGEYATGLLATLPTD